MAEHGDQNDVVKTAQRACSRETAMDLRRIQDSF
jgi:hypothetical protein